MPAVFTLVGGFEIVATVEDLRTLKSQTLVRTWLEVEVTSLGVTKRKPVGEDKFFTVEHDS